MLIARNGAGLQLHGRTAFDIAIVLPLALGLIVRIAVHGAATNLRA